MNENSEDITIGSSESFNDSPIVSPHDDRYGVDPFAQALAQSIRGLKSPEGTVIALNGSWGSGKSSAINLVLHHLREPVPAEQLTIVNFACWWFRGEEALALAFFEELNVALDPVFKEEMKKVLPKLGRRLLKTGNLIGPLTNLLTAGVGGEAVSGLAGMLGDLIEVDETVEHLHQALTKALRNQDRRFLIVVDDIDRLAPDETLLIFRLIKSVGRLPNVMYLLAYDRQLAESIVAERFPSEGPHYLEKIVQAAFELPEPQHSDLCSGLLAEVEKICGSPSEPKLVRFMNIFYDVVAPLLRTPRDIMRIANMLMVTWPSVEGEVDTADFLALESLRLAMPQIYRAIRSNRDKICGASSEIHVRRNREQTAQEYDNALLSSVSELDRQQFRTALMRLFPRLEAIWSNMHYGDSHEAGWRRDRLVCAREHFDTYFRFSVGEEALPASLGNSLVSRAGDGDFIKETLLAGLSKHGGNGQTQTALMLDELNLRAEEITTDNVEPLLSTIYGLTDDIDVPEDEAQGFSTGSNQLRVHWLTNRLVLERLDITERSNLLFEACKNASLAWLVVFSNSCARQHEGHEGQGLKPLEQRLVTEDVAQELQKLALERLHRAAADESLMKSRKLLVLLCRWYAFEAEQGAMVRSWTSRQLYNDEFVMHLAEAATLSSWSMGLGISGLGDRVSRRARRVDVSGLETIIDVERFRKRLTELETAQSISEDDREKVSVFLKAWREHEENPED